LHASSFIAGGLLLVPNKQLEFTFREGTVERLRQLHSFELWDVLPAAGRAWSVFVHALGPTLRRLDLNLTAFAADHFHQIAKSCPQLEEVILQASCEASHADVSHFIESAGHSLIWLQISELVVPEPVEVTASLMFESLTLYAKSIEGFQFSTGSGLDQDDLWVLADPQCMPRIRELDLDGFECTTIRKTDEGQPGEEGVTEESDEARTCGATIEAILKSHQSTLKSIKINEQVFRLGSEIVVKGCSCLPSR
jgi:hypothetical protein